MPNLAALALEHIMSTITPQSSFALLLATSSWDELHSLVEVSGIFPVTYILTRYIFLGLCGRKVGRSLCFCGIRTMLQGGCWRRVSFMADFSFSISNSFT